MYKPCIFILAIVLYGSVSSHTAFAEEPIMLHAHGSFEAASQGEMLASSDASQQFGAYVALEKIVGTLNGRKGSFVLVHRSLLRGGQPEGWTVTVVPGSGTEELAGIEGEMRITIKDGQHFYDFDYTLPE